MRVALVVCLTESPSMDSRLSWLLLITADASDAPTSLMENADVI